MSAAPVEEALAPLLQGADAYQAGSAWQTVRRGLALSPELRRGFAGTMALALVATAGQVVIPIAVQQTIDHGLGGPHGPDLALVRRAVLGAAGALVVTGVCASLMNRRLFRVSESALAGLRARAFRHVHDLSVLHQAHERRGALVSRVTGDVDEISHFLQWGGIYLLLAGTQILLATVLMAVYSWALTLLVWACFVPFALLLRRFQRRLDAAYLVVRQRIGDLLAAIAETVAGAAVVKAYGVEERTRRRVDASVDASVQAGVRASVLGALAYSSGELVAGLANALVVVAGVLLGIGGHLSSGRLVAFLFLVSLFVAPVQAATETLGEAQTAVAGWRRLLGILDTPVDVADPGPDGQDLPPGPLDVRFARVSYAYPGGPRVLHGIDLELPARRRYAVVGETGSGKTTIAKLLTRLMDPSDGSVLVGGVALPRVRARSLRRRVVLVPQDGFLFAASIADNVRMARPDLTDEGVAAALVELGLGEWLAGLPDGVRTQVGERGESMSSGERQLVAVARAYVADPDLLVLDEATSAVDPATEVRLAHALEALTRGRTTVTVAHRMSTAEAADEVLVVDRGRVVQRGRHLDLVARPGVYARLYASWAAQHRPPEE